MHHASANHDPFRHLDPGIWQATKSAHITLTVIGTLLLAPAALVLAVFWSSLQSSYMNFGSDEILMVGSAMTGAISGGFAWCALCLLFFKRSDLRWQRIAWTTCAIFGYLTTPCIIGWIIWILNHEPDSGGFILILLGIFISSVACMVLGRINARLAAHALKQKTVALRH
ncbi:hypothetical protein [Haloferula sp.]|uniref:hypothetical protein n=1 Tax=Haloferula sp. TaxID=2497595 RepID=UPI003C70C965